MISLKIALTTAILSLFIRYLFVDTKSDDVPMTFITTWFICSWISIISLIYYIWVDLP